jgi:hypothetical protein
MAKPSLFVGSSSEGLDFARAVRASLDDVAETTLWTDGVFGLGRTFIESLVSALSRFDFAALILSPDDKMTVRNDETLGPRDNVIFELGLFMGRLGRERTFIVRPESGPLKIPSDLAGMSVATYDSQRSDGNHIAALGRACDLMRYAIRDLGFAPAKTNAQVRALERAQDQQRQEIDALKFLVRNFVTEYELVHLRKLAAGGPFPFTPSGTFETELRRLIAMGLIRRRPGHGLRGMFAAADDAMMHLEITEEGRRYLGLRADQDEDS